MKIWVLDFDIPEVGMYAVPSAKASAWMSGERLAIIENGGENGALGNICLERFQGTSLVDNKNLFTI